MVTFGEHIRFGTMKKQLLALCAALTLSLPAALAGPTTLTSSQGLAINGLHAGSTFAVTLRQSDNTAQNSIKVTIDERLKPYLEVTVSGGILKLGFRDLPRELQKTNKWSCPATAEVTLSRVDRLIVSGMASVKPEGAFSGSAEQVKASGMGKIGAITIALTGSHTSDISVSGMSNANITLRGGKGASVRVSGQSKLALDCGAVQSLDIEARGMSNATVKGGAPTMETECSGQSKLSLDCGTIRSLTASTSGMASATVTGTAESVTAEASGNSHINLKELKAQRVKCETSGMSGISCYPTVSLDASASGNSSVRYRAGGALQTRLQKSGMSRISSLN